MKLRHLVVVVPGIGGSELQTPSGHLVWGRDVVSALIDPGRVSVEENRRLIPTDVVGSMRYVRGFPFGIHLYDQLIESISRTFDGVVVDVARPGVPPRLGADVLMFPYDFRLGVAHAAEQLKAAVDAHLGGLVGDARRARIVVVAHSMGGLVARYWLGPLGGAVDCTALITVGTPHRGAPKALDWLVNGVPVGPFRLRDVAQVLAGWQSVYELLPRYPAIRNADDGSALFPHQLTGVGPDGFAKKAADAYQMHLHIEEKWAALEGPARPEVIPLFARGHATLARATLRQGALMVDKQDAEWLPNVGWAGDGTVPAISAIPIELDERRGTWVAVTQRHIPMSLAQEITNILINYAGESLGPARGDQPAGPWLGLDLDDQVPAGQPVEVRVQVHGLVDGDTDGITVWVGGPGGPPRRQMTGTGDGWSAVLDPLPPGVHRIPVQAVNVPGPERIATEDVLAVVDLS